MCLVFPTLLLGDVAEPSTQWVVRTAVDQPMGEMRAALNALHQQCLWH